MQRLFPAPSPTMNSARAFALQLAFGAGFGEAATGVVASVGVRDDAPEAGLVGSRQNHCKDSTGARARE